jgi:UDP-N-acetylmuramoyl-L-alanyl-D-glutamate--2,6-diaminopimelate ligase
VAGIGRSGLAAARALAARAPGAVQVWDGLGRPHELEAAAALEAEGIACHRGDGLALLDGRPAPRTLVKSPGLPFTTPLVDAAVHRGLTVLDEAELGWRLDPRPFVAVTGTNGKSTTTSLIAAVLQAEGRAPVTAGNTRFGVPLSETHRHPGDVVVAELSSFQLEGCTALLPDAAVLTNVTLDHLYRHGSPAAYAACKRRLFRSGDDVVPVAAIGVDQDLGRVLAGDLRERGATVVTFGRHPSADRRVLEVEPVIGTGRLVVTEGSGRRTLRPQLTGAHNALNVVAALALADALGLDPGRAASAVEATAALPGRFEHLAAGAGYDVIVDYAHNPDGVAQTLRSARAILDARGSGALHVVLSTLTLVGRDQAQAVGRAGREGADHLVLTTQRWSLDDPGDAVAPGLLEGARAAAGGSLAVEADRAAAIARAVRSAHPGDVVLILDRGEAAGVLYGSDGQARPFDDRAEVRSLLAAAGG